MEVNAPSNWPSCPPREDVQVTLSHSQGAIKGSMTTCWGKFLLSGTINSGNGLSVKVFRWFDLVTIAHGSASPTRITLSGVRITLLLTR